MPFHIQPPEIKVPPDDPYANDLLDRKQSVHILTRLVASLAGPCVLAVDAPWGAGKTTFFNMWHQHLVNEGFLVAKFNAWDTDFSNDPLLALSTEMFSGLPRSGDQSFDQALDALRGHVPTILRSVGSSVISQLTHGFVDLPLLFEPSERQKRYKEDVKAFAHFRKKLSEFAEIASQRHNGRPLVVMIDELDRCRPSYAIELLEVAKHLFSSRHVIFVLALNRTQLEHSVRVLYGAGFDACGYLRRFVDLGYTLPEADRAKFIDATIVQTGIRDFYANLRMPDFEINADLVDRMLRTFLSLPHLSVRTISQALHRLGLAYNLFRDRDVPLTAAATAGIILRTLDENLYAKFRRGDASAGDVVRELADEPHRLILAETDTGFVFEALLYKLRPRETHPELIEYQRLVAKQGLEDPDGDQRVRHASDVMRLAANSTGAWHPAWLREALECIDFASESMAPRQMSDGAISSG